MNDQLDNVIDGAGFEATCKALENYADFMYNEGIAEDELERYVMAVNELARKVEELRFEKRDLDRRLEKLN
jgi:hypothetical protein